MFFFYMLNGSSVASLADSIDSSNNTFRASVIADSSDRLLSRQSSEYISDGGATWYTLLAIGTSQRTSTEFLFSPLKNIKVPSPVLAL